MPNNSYVLTRTVRSFTRPNNTTDYPAFRTVSDAAGSPLLIPAPVQDRPFYIRRLGFQSAPGVAVGVPFTIFVYNADPTPFSTFTDQGSINQGAIGAAGVFESRLSGTLPVNSQYSSTEIAVGNFCLNAPLGVYYLAFENGVTFTPTANQKFTVIIVTEYAN